MTIIICDDCKRVAHYEPYFDRHVCNHCGKVKKRQYEDYPCKNSGGEIKHKKPGIEKNFFDLLIRVENMVIDILQQNLMITREEAVEILKKENYYMEIIKTLNNINDEKSYSKVLKPKID